MVIASTKIERDAPTPEDDALNWKWNTGPLSWRDTCFMCQQALRIQGDGGVVTWTDDKHYHLSCLLDRLAIGRPSVPMTTIDSVSHWGLVP